MLEFIKNAVFGSSRRHQQSISTSESKRRYHIQDKRAYSFESKPKLAQKDEAKPRRNNKEFVIITDQTATVRRLSPGSNKKTNHSQGREQDVQLSIDEQEEQELKSFKQLLNKFEKEQLNYSHPFKSKIQKNDCNRPNPEEYQNKKKNQQRKSLFQNNKKLIVKRQPSRKIIQKIKQRCSFCGKNLQFEDSYQMACIHRCHKNCANEMKWKMKFNCKICQVKLDHQRCSIISHSIHRRKKVN